MLFSLHNAGTTFQRLMDSLLGGLPLAFGDLDDILVNSAAKHCSHLCTVFSLLKQSGLVFNTEKCIFGYSSIEFLGHHLSSTGSSPLLSRVESMAVFPRPATIRQLQAFLGSQVSSATDSRLCACGSPYGNQLLEWSTKMAAAFKAARLSLSSTAVLEHPVAKEELSLMADISSTHSLSFAKAAWARVAATKFLFRPVGQGPGELQSAR
jgi:hypothetical protein